jgi:hypothetical protein
MKDYFHGNIQGIKLCDVARSLVDLLPTANSIAVRSIDSTVLPESLCQILDLHQIVLRRINGNILLTRESLLQVLSKRLLTGFDELWFFETEGPTHDLRYLPRATSDSEDFSVCVPSEIINAAQENKCVFVGGDGDSLNYLTPNPLVQKSLTNID